MKTFEAIRKLTGNARRVVTYVGTFCEETEAHVFAMCEINGMAREVANEAIEEALEAGVIETTIIHGGPKFGFLPALRAAKGG